MLLIGLTLGARALGLWPDDPPGDPNNITISYSTEGGDGVAKGVVNSPLRITVRIPWSTGSQDTIISGVALQILDENNALARFGTSTTESEPLAMKPTFDIAAWEWRGSVPSDPGKYHARVQITALYNKERDETKELPDPILEAVPESGAPLTSGYVFPVDSNLWLLSTDGSRQRRLTYFPEFYEYADKPRWSPDGSSIAFTYSPRAADGELPVTEIWSITPGSTPQPLVRSTNGELLLDPAWSGDGKYLYFTSDTSATAPITATSASLGASVQIQRVELATGAREQWMPSSEMPASVGTTGDTVFLEYVPSTDDSEGLIAPLQRMVRAKADGQTRTMLVDENTFQLMYAPAASPNGKWVAFSAVNVPPIGKDPFPTTVPFHTPTPNPNPGGDLDLFSWLGITPRQASGHGLPWDLFLVSAEGGQPTRLTTMDEDQPYPVWMDNSTIAFMGTTGLYTLSIDANGNPVGMPNRVHDGTAHGGLAWRGP